MKSDNRQLVGYSYADFAGDLDDRHSTTGTLFFTDVTYQFMIKKQLKIIQSAGNLKRA